MLNSLVRVSRRGKENHFARTSVEPTAPRVASGRCNQVWQTLVTAPRPASRGGSMTLLDTGFLRFRFSNFRYSLTLFSKSFASFPHGTCALSVSHQYLALDGIYHPLRAAIPNNSTLRHGLHGQANGSITLSAVLFQGTWPGTMSAHVHRPQFNAGLVAPIHTVSSSRFSRPYWGNPGWFLFLRLIICLNSAGLLA
jgi:hypothetical protein